jgi:hypothetical protein
MRLGSEREFRPSSIARMPNGVPVACVGVDNGDNAVLQPDPGHNRPRIFRDLLTALEKDCVPRRDQVRNPEIIGAERESKRPYSLAKIF